MSSGKNNFPKQSSIYWFNPEPTKGSEINKIRPCVVVSPNSMNKHLNTVIIAPLTTQIRDWPFRCNVKVLGQASQIACDQIRAIDTSRLLEHISELTNQEKQTLYPLLHTILSE